MHQQTGSSSAETIAATAIYTVIEDRLGNRPPSFADVLTILHDILKSYDKLLGYPAVNEALLLFNERVNYAQLSENHSLPLVKSPEHSGLETLISSVFLEENGAKTRGELISTERIPANKEMISRSGKSSRDVNAMKTRHCDGLDTPAPVHMVLDRSHDESYAPDCSARESLQRLVPEKMGESHLFKLLEDFEEFTKERPLGEGRLTEDECLALFAYTYEIKVPAQELLPQCSGHELQVWINGLLQKMLEDPLSEGALEAHIGTDVLDHIIGGQCLDGLPDEDAAKLQRLFNWTTLPENYVSHSYQLYRDMNEAMRSSYDAKPGSLEIYLPLVYHTKAALRKLSKSLDSSKTHGRHSTIVYRGIDISIEKDKYHPGTTVCWPAFSSTSLSNEVAKSFLAGHATGTLFIIETTSACNISSLSHFPEEEEHLLPPHSFFRVKGMASSGIRQILGLPESVQIVELRELDEAESKVEFIVAEASYQYKNYNKKDALHLYDEAYHKYPQTSMGLFCRGMALAWDKKGLFCPKDMEMSVYHTWRLSESVEYFMKALDKEPWHPMILTHYAYVLRMKGDKASARYYFWHALQIDPVLADAIHGLAEIYLLENEFHELEKLGRKHAEIHLTSSMAMWRCGHSADAKNAAFKAYLADPYSKDTHEWLKEIFNKLDMQEEKALLEQAQQEHAADPLGSDAFYEYLAMQFDVDHNPFCVGRNKMREPLQAAAARPSSWRFSLSAPFGDDKQRSL